MRSRNRRMRDRVRQGGTGREQLYRRYGQLRHLVWNYAAMW